MMVRNLAVLVGSILCLALSAGPAEGAALKAGGLRCEYKSDPRGIDITKPRLSWVLEATDPATRGLKQGAYEILVASSKEKIDAGEGDLWSTKKVDSDETIQIVYGGKALATGLDCWWKVRVWSDGENEPSDWSAAGHWSMGLLDANEWKAKWIGFDEPEASAERKTAAAENLEKLSWVWTDEANDKLEAPAGPRFFAKKVNLAGSKVVAAKFLVTADNSYNVVINGKTAGSGGDFHEIGTLDATKLLHPGENMLAVRATNDGGPAGLIGRLVVWMENANQPVIVDIDASWKVSKEQPKDWETGTFDSSDWTAAKALVAVGAGPWGKPETHHLNLLPPPMLRKGFAIDKPVKRATAYATALGIYQLRLNGKQVGDDPFSPGWTDYKKRVYYNAYDVTSLLKQGDNAAAALLGKGWYAGYYAWGQKSQWYGKDARLMAQIDIEFQDGTKQSIVTDDSWKAAYGPWREADLIMGSAYDAQKEIAGWDAAGFDDASWKPVIVAAAPKIKVEAYPGDPVRPQETIDAKNITEPTPGAYVFDLGQNMVGWAQFKLSGLQPGQKLRFRYSEMLNADGTPYTIALRGARVTDFYTAGSEGDVTWQPIFTSHGFRYVEITGLTGKPSLDTVKGVVVNADIPRTGTFESSSPAVNQLFHNIIWGQKGNYFEVPTDCPQRDERLGWTGDAQFFVRTAAYNFDVSAFFTKWLVDLITDAQYPDGSFADVAPDLTGGHGNVAWGDAGIVCPYTIYKVYGDTRIIEQHYDAMVKYIEFLKKNSKDLIREQGAYGDWVNQGGGAKSEVIGTSYFCYVTKLMSEMAAAIGKKDDADQFAKLSDQIKAAFIKNFVAEDGSIKDSSQTGYALAFTMGLIPDDRRKAAADRFVAEIEKKHWHLATGFIGTPRLLPALTSAGRNDVAYKLFLTDTFPSWLFQVKNGSTTMWERWDGWTPDKGFQDPAMNSFNHYAFGSVGEWMYRTVGGIDTDGPGYKKITLRPMPGPGLTFATAKYDSVRGAIGSAWKEEAGALTATFVVPPNTTATIHVPTKDASSVTEGGKPVKQSKGVKFLRAEDGAAVYEVGSGTYEFAAK